MQNESQKPGKRSTPSAMSRCWLPAAVAVLILCGCLSAAPPGNPSSDRLSVETIWAGNQCGCEDRQPRVRWMADRNQLTAALAAAGSKALETRFARYSMDWQQDGLVWIDMGLKPSGGYALSLARPVAALAAGVAVITVQWRHPRPGSVVTQQLTAPCLLVRLERGKFHSIKIEDETGRERAGLQINRHEDS
jgi:hypothetical protein